MTKKYFRSVQARIAYMRTMKSQFRRLFEKARKLGWRQTFLLEQRAKLIDGDGINTAVGSWQKLTATDQAELFGYWEALTDLAMGQMEFRYLINGIFYTPDEVIARKDGVEPSRDATSQSGHYVWVLNLESGPVYHIYS
jgi:hypothetical protein